MQKALIMVVQMLDCFQVLFHLTMQMAQGTTVPPYPPPSQRRHQPHSGSSDLSVACAGLSVTAWLQQEHSRSCDSIGQEPSHAIFRCLVHRKALQNQGRPASSASISSSYQCSAARMPLGRACHCFLIRTRRSKAFLLSRNVATTWRVVDWATLARLGMGRLLGGGCSRH